MRCYTCGKIGHMSWDCPKNKVENNRIKHVVETKEEDVNAVEKEENP
jgi:DNA-directed RNA polymerase subunit N (RpoN/RPB10)